MQEKVVGPQKSEASSTMIQLEGPRISSLLGLKRYGYLNFRSSLRGWPDAYGTALHLAGPALSPSPALSEEIKKYGDAIAEVRIRRTTSHNCVMKVKHKRPGVWVAAATRAALVTECISKRSSPASHRTSVAY